MLNMDATFLGPPQFSMMRLAGFMVPIYCHIGNYNAIEKISNCEIGYIRLDSLDL
jgi:hypothetical protein